MGHHPRRPAPDALRHQHRHGGHARRRHARQRPSAGQADRRRASRARRARPRLRRARRPRRAFGGLRPAARLRHNPTATQSDGLRVWFSHADGLRATGSAVHGFEVAGPDNQFHAADADNRRHHRHRSTPPPCRTRCACATAGPASRMPISPTPPACPPQPSSA